jgi:uncharacterized protein
VLFDRETLGLKPLSREWAESLAQIIQQSSQAGEEPHSWMHLQQLVEAVDSLPGVQVPSPEEPDIPVGSSFQGGGISSLFKLAISVADTCNMACSYCYANKGQFDRSVGELMSPEIAQTVVENAVRSFDSIEVVQFIGGEPTINLPAIERVCGAFARAVDAEKLPFMPKFVLTTNGLAVSETLLSLARTFQLHLTVSLDGPEEIHNRARKSPDGKGTYNRIRNGIDRMQEFGLLLDFEATFSRLHLQAGVHLIDLCRWFREELGIRVLHAPPVSAGAYVSDNLTLAPAEIIREYCAAAEWGVDNFIARNELLADSFTARVIRAIATKSRSQSICSAGSGLVCVSADGSLYPCWMFIGEQALRIGSFGEPREGEWDWTILHNLFAPGDLQGQDCQACWAQSLCFGCRGAQFRATGNLEKKHDCRFTQALLATILMRIFGPAEADSSTNAYLSRPSMGEILFPEAGESAAGRPDSKC